MRVRSRSPSHTANSAPTYELSSRSRRARLAALVINGSGSRHIPLSGGEDIEHQPGKAHRTRNRLPDPMEVSSSSSEDDVPICCNPEEEGSVCPLSALGVSISKSVLFPYQTPVSFVGSSEARLFPEVF